MKNGKWNLSFLILTKLLHNTRKRKISNGNKNLLKYKKMSSFKRNFDKQTQFVFDIINFISFLQIS